MQDSNLTVILADDERVTRNILAEYLRAHFNKVVEVADGWNTYEFYRSMKPDLIVTDINMPGMDGLSLIEKIRSEDETTPIIVISAHSETDKLLRAVKLKLVDYVVKPINPTTIHTLVEKALHARSKSKQLASIIPLGHGYSFDMDNDILFEKSKVVRLTRQQSRLLHILVKNRNRVIPSEELFYHVKDDYGASYSSSTIRNLVKRLREMLPEEMISNVYGSGYCLNVEAD